MSIARRSNSTLAIRAIFCYYEQVNIVLQGRVQFPTGGKVREPYG